MLTLRHSLLRALPINSSTSVAARSARSFVSLSSLPSPSTCYTALSRPQQSAVILHALRRTYATEGDEATKEQFESTGESVSSTSYDNSTTGAKDVESDGNNPSDGFIADVKKTVSETVSAGVATGRAAADRVRNTFGDGRGGFQREPRAPVNEPTAEEAGGHMYLANLYFDLSENDLHQELSRFGPVKFLKIIVDPAGLSKGFGYVKMEKVEDAIAARDALDGTFVQGRRLVVQHSIEKTGFQKRNARDAQDAPKNPPSKTLFIGNMSYDTSNDDLNELFKDVQNVTDVRVAVDRRTGQPRGFAHAEFEDVASAEAAAEYIGTLTPHGRRLRVDFAASKLH